MTLHVFNPEHDLALAANIPVFTPPHAARMMRADMGFLPSIWAEEGDAVLVDDVELAQEKLLKAEEQLDELFGWRRREVHFLPRNRALGIQKSRNPEISKPRSLESISAISPWGWDKSLCHDLLKCGVDEALLPDETRLEAIRNMSHRRTAIDVLAKIVDSDDRFVGYSEECFSLADIENFIERHGHTVVKSPWSCSGRGVRFIETKYQLTAQMRGWIQNTLQQQGSVVAEPYYNKVEDLAMEFYSDGNGHVKYCGLSLFHTENGFYIGNILATEEQKTEMISRYISAGLLATVRERLCALLGQGVGSREQGAGYCGPIGVDMMIVSTQNSKLNARTCSLSQSEATERTQNYTIHPCVEINLRRTMGHVALALAPTNGAVGVMRTDKDYQLKITKL